MDHKKIFVLILFLFFPIIISANDYIFEGIEWVSIFTETYSFNDGVYCKRTCDNDENWIEEQGKYTIFEENSYTVAKIKFENHETKMFLFCSDDRHLIIYDCFSNKQITCTNSKYHIDEAYIWAIDECTSTSYLTEKIRGKKISYIPDNLADNDITKKWVEGKPGNGEGEILRIKNDLSKPKILYFINGYFSPYKTYLYYDNARIKNCLIRCYDENNNLLEEFDYEFKDTGNLQSITFKNKYTFFEVIIKSVYEGKKYQDTAISAILVDGLSVL